MKSTYPPPPRFSVPRGTARFPRRDRFVSTSIFTAKGWYRSKNVSRVDDRMGQGTLGDWRGDEGRGEDPRDNETTVSGFGPRSLLTGTRDLGGVDTPLGPLWALQV